jgi:hypothetical protein
VICVDNAELAPKFSLIFAPGCAASNCFAMVVNASCSEEAANTLTVPLTAAAEELPGDDAGLDAAGDEPDLLEEHPALRVTAAAASAVMAVVRRCMAPPQAR